MLICFSAVLTMIITLAPQMMPPPENDAGFWSEYFVYSAMAALDMMFRCVGVIWLIRDFRSYNGSPFGWREFLGGPRQRSQHNREKHAAMIEDLANSDASRSGDIPHAEHGCSLRRLSR